LYPDLLLSLGLFDCNIENDISRIRTRTFILWGDADWLLDVSDMPILEKGIGGCVSYVLKNCGELPMLERPAKTAKVCRDFIEMK
jgi:abhydrolase domain-containing protein 6